jgi:DNA (cytosine-5)-methyltransferase 1
MRHGSLFSGIGGFDLAAEWMGWNNVFHCEWNEFGQKILKHYWPKAISYGDITKTDFTIHRGTVDILTGGFPCQPYSLAGKRKGKEDDRHLWPEMLRAIHEIQPAFVVGENVPGLINWSGGLVFEEVQSQMEVEGYEVIPFILPACGVNAPHKRERIWFIAYSCNNRNRQLGESTSKQGCGIDIEKQKSRTQYPEQLDKLYKSNGSFTNPRSMGWQSGTVIRRKISEEFRGAESTVGVTTSDVTDTINQGLQGGQNRREFKSIRKGEKQQLTGLLQPTWEMFPTQSPLCSRDDGISSKLDGITFPKWRNESIKAMGNAIVPQVAYQIFKAIEEFVLSENKA